MEKYGRIPGYNKNITKYIILTIVPRTEIQRNFLGVCGAQKPHYDHSILLGSCSAADPELHANRCLFIVFSRYVSLFRRDCVVELPALWIMEITRTWLILNALFSLFSINNSLSGPRQDVTYSREYLMSLQRHTGHVDLELLTHDCPEIAQKPNFKAKNLKKRGARGGIRARLRKRGARFPLPMITLSNVRSLNNKMDELMARVKVENDFKMSNLICLTETWLKDETEVALPGYITIRADWDKHQSNKSIGGGMCIFVDSKWATHLRIHEKECTPNYELLSVSIRPFYLPREFGQITIILVYIPGPKYEEVAGRISESFNNALSRSVDQPIFILGDFNNCKLSSHLPTL